MPPVPHRRHSQHKDPANRSTTRNLLHLARMIKDASGIPAHVNQRSEWDASCRFDCENPDYR